MPETTARFPRIHSLGPLCLLVLLGVAGCDARPDDDAPDGGAAAAAPDRPDARTDTIRLEGMAETIPLHLFRAPDFPLPFSAYVPADMAAEVTEERSVHFTAEFGGVRTEDGFVHLYVFPPDTDLQAAIAHAKGYKTGRGIPVGQGIEIIADEIPPPQLEWAVEAFSFRYQSGGQWYAGSIGVGRHNDRLFMIVRHHPAELGDGFAPRADLLLETWMWEDGSPLQRSPPEPPPIVEEEPTLPGSDPVQ